MSRDSSRSDSDDLDYRVIFSLGRSQRHSLRKLLERVGITITMVLSVVMLTVIVLDWLRFAPEWAVVGPPAAFLFDQFLTVGAWIDVSIGTNVFRHPFMWRAIATGGLIGIVAPIVGTYLVHRQMALIGETLAHTAFAGVAIGLLFVAVTGWQGSLLIVALLVSALGAIGLQWLTEHTSTYGDVPVAIVLSGSFAIGTLLISWGRNFASMAIDVEGFLFGSLAIVTVEGARMVAVLTVAVIAVVAITYKQLLFITFDEQTARVAQLRVDRYNTLLIVMTAVVVVGAMQILGVILVAGMLVVPVATASQIAYSFRETMVLSFCLGNLRSSVGWRSRSLQASHLVARSSSSQSGSICSRLPSRTEPGRRYRFTSRMYKKQLRRNHRPVGALSR